MGSDSVQLFGMWVSPFVVRVIWALNMKQIQYKYVEEDLSNKSPLLLQYNPVHKKVPVLLHGQNPIAESLAIIEYIDETWKHDPIMPEDPYERAMARFLAKFVEDQVTPSIFRVFTEVGEKQEEALKEAGENLKTLEEGLKGKKFFGGETIGFVDFAVGWIPYYIRGYEQVLGVTMIEKEEMPLLWSWSQEFLNIDIVKECLPPVDKLLAHLKGMREKIVAMASA